MRGAKLLGAAERVRRRVMRVRMKRKEAALAAPALPVKVIHLERVKEKDRKETVEEPWSRRLACLKRFQGLGSGTVTPRRERVRNNNNQNNRRSLTC